MEAGIWSLLPAVLAIVLAIITKQVVLSLGAGIIIGALILNGFNPVAAFTSITATLIENVADPEWNTPIIVFCLLLGGIIGMINASKAATAFGNFIARRVRTQRGGLLTTWFLGVLVFIDDYFNSLSVGAIMRPVSDRLGISREKLAYTLDSTAAPVCILAPVSTWVAYVMSLLATEFSAAGIDKNPFVAFIELIPYNFYALLALVLVVILAIIGKDYGPMVAAQARTRASESEQAETNSSGLLSVLDLLLPMLSLVLVTLIGMLATGGYFEGGIGIADAFRESDPAMGLIYGGVFSLLFTIVWYLCRRQPVTRLMEGFGDGFKSMLDPVIILALAWTIGSVTGELGAGEYLASVIGANIPAFVLPLLLFAIAGFTGFSTGSSWGTFAIMIPLAVPAAMAVNPELLMPMLAAVLGGAVFGDHCSPLSDSTILSSAGAGCNHIDHVSTQLPYALTGAAAAAVAFLLAGFGISPWLALPAGLLVLIALVRFLTTRPAPIQKTLDS
ncbi:MAG: Na+/H+ antiporter NhaC family protein [Firmicutes bacterium]|nr:Na+/H+ antiporter NhaC family protein [Bacillota bacterium]